MSDDDFEDPYEAFQRSTLRERQHRTPVREGDGSSEDDHNQTNAHEFDEFEANARTLEVEEPEGDDDSDFESALSPPRRRHSGTSAAPKACARQPAFKRTDQKWQHVADGIDHTELDDFIAGHGKKIAAGRGFTSAGKWRPSKRARGSVKVWRCNFAQCPAMLRAIKYNNGSCCVMESTARTKQHNNHIERTRGVPGVPGEIRALLSPTKLALGPKRCRAYLRKQSMSDGVPVKLLLDAPTDDARKLRSALEKLHKTFLQKQRSEVMTEGKGGSFGGLSSTLEKYERDLLEAKGSFNEHSVFLLGKPLVVPETGRVTYAVSTENLLLNAYRQTQFGLPPMICVDTTHRLVIEGHCCMLIGTMSVTQHFHTIAYGVCSHEDAEAHKFVFRQVVDAVNVVVHDRAVKKQRV